MKPGTRLRIGMLGVVAAVAGRAAPLRGQTAAGDGGVRPLAVTFSYGGELVGNAAGGVRRGAAFAGAAGAQATLQLEPLAGWHGASLFVFVLGTHGGAPSGLVGDVQGVSNLQAPPAVRLEEAWLQQNLLAGRVSWLAGRYDLNTEFYRLQSGALFLNSSFGIGPEFAQSGAAGPSIYPNTAAGSRVDVKPSANVVVRAAVLDGVPVDRPGGGVRLFARGDGALLVGELAVVARPDTAGMPRHRRFAIGRGSTRPYAAKLAVGGWYYTARFPDLSATLPSGAPVPHRGSRGAYLIADRTLWAAKDGGPGTLTAFLQLGLGDGRVNQVAAYAGGGLTLAAPIAGRPLDALGLAVAAARNGSHFAAATDAAGPGGETTVELTYAAQLGSWLSLQPDAQYVIHPGGVAGRRNALALGLRVAASR